jgi:hypothetical protein
MTSTPGPAARFCCRIRPPVHLITSRGKNGTIFLLNRDDMGGFNSSGDQVVQEITSQTDGAWSSPSYFNGRSS